MFVFFSVFVCFSLSRIWIELYGTNPQLEALLCVIASLPTQAQSTIFCRVCGLSSSTAIMGRMHAPG